MVVESGKRLNGWGHPRRTPAGRWTKFGPHNTYVIEHRHWLDHLWRAEIGNEIIYVAEPYTVGQDDLLDLVALAADGWSVSIDGLGEHHDTTVRIILSHDGISYFGTG